MAKISESSITVWDRFKYQTMGNLSFGNFRLSNLFNFASAIVTIGNGISVFLLTLYQGIPPMVERVADTCLEITRFFTKQQNQIAEKATEFTNMVDEFNTIQQADNGQGIMDTVIYVLNLDMARDGMVFSVSVCFIWVFLVLAVLGFATALLLSGVTIYVSRRGIAFLTAGQININ